MAPRPLTHQHSQAVGDDAGYSAPQHRRRGTMGKGRLEAFSDGVLAIIITIMVLELKVPHGVEPRRLRPLMPVFLSYVLSFVYVGIYWNNHHHMLQVDPARSTARSCGRTCTCCSGSRWCRSSPAWMGENHFAPVPVGALRRRAAPGGDRVLAAPARDHRTQKGPIRCWRRPWAPIGKASCRRCSTPSPSRRRSCARGLRGGCTFRGAHVARPGSSHRAECSERARGGRTPMSSRPIDLFRRLTNGLYVVGVAHDDRRDAFTAAWVTQVSFEPLLLALSINPSHASYKSSRRERRLHGQRPASWPAGAGAPLRNAIGEGD